MCKLQNMSIGKEHKITFQPSGRSVYAMPGTILIEAAARAGCVIDTPCGGASSCGKCAVRILTSIDTPATANEVALLGKEKTDNGFRLSCSFRIKSDLTVEIPRSALFQTGQQILSSHGKDTLHIDPAVAIPEDIEETVTGIAFDIGTTTVVGTMVDLRTGEDLALASTINPQTSFGDDVVSRIKKCREEDSGLAELSNVIRTAVNDLCKELCEQTKLSSDSIKYAVFAGNTAMQQIFAGIDPSGLGELPFAPAFTELLILKAGDIGLNLSPDTEVLIFPQIGGFVGGDTVAGILATRLDQSERPALMVDVGTNGEIVLAANGKLLSASVAAGPAFEGARIINGMRAASGAIEKVVFANDDIQLNIIGNAKAIGLCGTGLIDAVAVLLRLGVIDITGRIVEPEELPESTPASIKERIVEKDGTCNFILARSDETATGEDILLYQRDIRELQLANGAIRAGINILLKTAGIDAEDLDRVLLAGAFGNFIRRNNACRIGMLPNIPDDRIRFVGNTASFGAKRVLLSKKEAQYASDIRAKCEHVELSTSPDFQDEFGAAMLFPEDD